MTKVAVVGVMESVGREILSFLEADGIKAKDVFALEPKCPLGNQVSYGEDDELDVLNLDDFDFSKTDVVIFAGNAETSKRFVKKAAQHAKVIDCTDTFFAEPDVPMIIAGLNDEQIVSAKHNIVSLPSAMVTQMLLPIEKVIKNNKIKRIVVSAYISASVYGKDGMDELFNQTRKIFMNETLVDDQQVFHKQIAFNVIPQVGEFIGEETQCEWSMNAETKKILGGDIKVHANCAIVPAFIGAAQFVNVECEQDVDVDAVRGDMKSAKGIVVFDKNVEGGYVSLTDVQGEDEIYVSRLRQDASVENGFSFWSVADNLRVGVAKNAFEVMKQILAEKN